jgi:hypothetical protein
MENEMFKKSIICAVAALSIAAVAASPANALSRDGALALGLGIGTVSAIGFASAQPSYKLIDYREHRHREHRHGDGGGVYFGVGGPGFGIYSGNGYFPGYYGGGYDYRPEGGGYRFWSRRCAERWGYDTPRWNRCMDRHGV